MIDIRELCGDIDFFSGNVGFPDGFTPQTLRFLQKWLEPVESRIVYRKDSMYHNRMPFSATKSRLEINTCIQCQNTDCVNVSVAMLI